MKLRRRRLQANDLLGGYENVGPNWSAYVPDLPGCIATGDTIEDCKSEAREAIEANVEAARKLGRPVPAPSTKGEYVRARSA